ncbi:hypothetical protein [Vibrio hyugaensis]|uniref:hypothetical protein n=1 Tax=Vibrio hyugaensis TaxID=1534743 RepID=UPI000CE47A5F|nr:hypothetical protein [Vibrio hyugaensis]
MKLKLISLSIASSFFLIGCGGSDSGGKSEPTETMVIGGSISNPSLFTVADDVNLKVQNSHELSHFKFYADAGATVTVQTEVGEINDKDAVGCVVSGNENYIEVKDPSNNKRAGSCNDVAQFYVTESGEHVLSFDYPSDNQGKAKVHFTYDNQAPEFTLNGETSFKVHDSRSLTINANDPNGDELSYSIKAPEFVSLEDWHDRPVIVVYPEPEHAGDHLVEIIVTDHLGLATTKHFTFSVVENRAPTFTVEGETTINIDELYGAPHTLKVSMSDADGDHVSFGTRTSQFVPVSISNISDTVGLIDIHPTREHVGKTDLTITIHDEHGLSSEKTITLNVVFNATDLEPSEPVQPTIATLAEKMGYTGDIAKLELLFQIGSDLAWKIDENGQPVIYTTGDSRGVYHFYPLTSKLVVYAENYVDEAELLDVSNSKITGVSVSYNEAIENYVSHGVNKDALDYSYIGGIVEFNFTDTILEKILVGANGIELNIEALNVVTQETVTLDITAVINSMGETYRQVLRDVLIDYADISRPDLAEFAELTGTTYYDLLTLTDSTQVIDFIVEDGKPIVYTYSYDNVKQRRIDLENGTMENYFVSDYRDGSILDIKEILSYEGSAIGDHDALKDDPNLNVEFSLIDESNFSATVTNSITKPMIDTLIGATYRLTVNYVKNEDDYQTYVIADIGSLSTSTGAQDEFIRNLLTKYISL